MGPLLTTKLHAPRRRHSVVSRPRLSAQLERGDEAALTLVSAPAGFGKTSVLADWLTSGGAAGQRSVAWLSLDSRDSDPAVFWTYVVAALQTVVPDVGAGALALLQSPQTPAEASLALLVNDLAAVPRDVVLVLDDYHLIDSPDVQEGMEFLLEHLPAQVHVVIASRADPPLPLARLRSRGELVELRAADLRFTPEEAAAYLTEVVGLALTADDVAALESRTEGWIAALQLAALSMQGRADVRGFIAGFAGDDRYIVDYLVEEVLQRQPERIRTFLLETSILSRLSAPLCDAVTGRDDGRVMLEALDRGNLFLVALDGRRQWYRYHHLFSDVLHAHLLDEQPDAVADLHRRAGGWHEQRGHRSEAIAHALAGRDFTRAADLVELAGPELLKARQEATMRGWLGQLPDEVIRIRPVLSVAYAGVLMVSGEVHGVETRLRDAERCLTTIGNGRGSSGQIRVVDEEAFGRLPSAIALYRAGQAHLSGDVRATIGHARRALDLAHADDHAARAGPAGLLGLAYWKTGDLDTGYRWYAECAASLEQTGHLSDVSGCAVALADIRLTQGRLGDALSLYERTLRLVTPPTGPVLRGAADMHVGIAGVLIERGELDAARRHLAASRDLGEHLGMPQNPYRSRVAEARVLEAEGDPDGALVLLEEAERCYVGDYFPEVRPVPALRARFQARHGRWAEALTWAQQRGLTVDDEVDYLHEFEHLALSRALIARFTVDRDEPALEGALRLLTRLVQAADAGGRVRSAMEALVGLAVAESARGQRAAAVEALRRALVLAEPAGHRQVFLDEGAALADPLHALATATSGAGHARQLVRIVDRRDDGTPAPVQLVDPLSARELDVLRLLGTDLDGPDIARRLFVSVNTVRTHTRAIYTKLGVSSRRAAVRRGEELELTGRHGAPRSTPV
jgi:LuxR family maltose regulon positive regulatory protein